MWQQFAHRYGAAQAARARMAAAPGRVNLIGEHTDYNGGFVFPIAIDFRLRLLGAARGDRRIRAYSLDFAEAVEFDLDRIEPDPEHTWSNYLRGVCLVLQETGRVLRGMDLLVAGDVPQGAGLSSSAAFEVAAALLCKELSSLDLPDLELIRLCQRAENDFVGVNCGIMDQFVSRLGRKGHALLLDCRDLSYSHHPLDPAKARVIVVNSGVRHALVSSEYNLRRRQCEEGAAALGERLPSVRSLRDVSPRMLDEFDGALDPVVARRCRHVVLENERTLDAAKALDAGDLERFGRLMYESHQSLRDLYEVSCAELDLLVGLARGLPGVYGARMTGGGFGGCTVNLVRPEAADGFAASIRRSYEKETGRKPEVYLCTAAAGAGIEETEA
ncbi:MAG: galactokinase [Patescibacteria group bacterium]